MVDEVNPEAPVEELPVEAPAPTKSKSKAKAEPVVSYDSEPPVVTEITVETTGEFMLYDITTGAVIEAEGATLVPDSVFIRDRIAGGQLKLVD